MPSPDCPAARGGGATRERASDPELDERPLLLGGVPRHGRELLIDRVGLRREDLVGLSRADAIARLNAYWTTGC